MSIFEQVEKIENYNVYSCANLTFKGLVSSNENGEPIAMFQIETQARAKVYFWYDEGDYSHNREYAQTFYKFFVFVIDEHNLYVGDKTIPLINLRDIWIDEIVNLEKELMGE